MSFPAYSSYRNSGIDWLGEIPADWRVQKFRFTFRESDEKIDSEVVGPMLSVSGYRGIEVKEYGDENQRRTDEDLIGYRVVRPGQLVVNSMWLNYAGLGISAHEGHVSPAYRAYWFRDQSADPRFVHYLLRSTVYVQGYTRLLTGIRPNSLQMSRADLMDFAVLLPPVSTQVAVTTFLDRETAKIDALIEEQRRLTALLKEKRQAVISNAVTKGLDYNAPFKDSGIEWLGEVPAHWDVRKLTAMARLESGHTPSRQRPDYWVEEDCVIPWFTLADVGQLRSGRFPRVVATTQRISELGMANSAARLLPTGTVILSRTASVGFAGITEIDLAVSQDFAAWVCGTRLNAEFLLVVLQAMRGEFARLMMGSTHKTIYMPDIEAFTVPLPPVAEQAKIVDHVASALASIDVLNDACEAGIKLLHERRAALISAAVTGKIDVRESAKVLPFPMDRARARRLVATEIIERFAHQATFGRTKLQKVVYLAEAHANITELAGCYIRMPYGPLDQPMMDEIEATGGNAGIVVEDNRNGSMVRYRATGAKGMHTEDLRAWLGESRYAKLDHLIKVLSDLKTHSAEAIATLYAVWNDALIEGKSLTDEEIISAFFGWNPKKGENFRADELPSWLDWMRRHGLVPTGSGPKTAHQMGTLL